MPRSDSGLPGPPGVAGQGVESRSGFLAWPWHPDLLPTSEKKGVWGCRAALLSLGSLAALAAWPLSLRSPAEVSAGAVLQSPFCFLPEVREALLRLRGGGSPGWSGPWPAPAEPVCTDTEAQARAGVKLALVSRPGLAAGRRGRPRWVPACLERGSCGFLRSGL